MQKYKCLECDNEYYIILPEGEEDKYDEIAFCPFCSEPYIIKTSDQIYEN